MMNYESVEYLYAGRVFHGLGSAGSIVFSTLFGSDISKDRNRGTLGAFRGLFPESPVYLLGKGKEEEARKSYMWYRGGNAVLVEEEIARTKKFLQTSRQTVSLKGLMKKKGTLIAFGTVMLIPRNNVKVVLFLTQGVRLRVETGSTMRGRDTAGNVAFLVSLFGER
ncbi:hypothetical protein C0J52_14838 [Blattella germanica]|nr:hypothetical protein C0J52_14838 [Blattella germanica]